MKKIRKKIDQYRKYTFMSQYDLEYICNTINRFKPKKILEVGVGFGGTNMIIKHCLNNMPYNSEMYSVDINETITYNEEIKKIGFVINDNDIQKVSSKMFLGYSLPQVIEKIGKDIDMVILDTTHVLPGELLDFIICLPFLSSNACVILHDVVSAYAHDIEDEHILWSTPNAFATCLLFSSVVADKTLEHNFNFKYIFSNISSFRINNQTIENMDNLFYSLLIRWRYFPDKQSLESYNKIILENYGEKYSNIFKNICKINEIALKRTEKLNKDYISY